jgi:hypothetical protein
VTDVRCIAGPRFELVWNRGQGGELDDTWSDPGERRNGILDQPLAPVRRALWQRLLAWLCKSVDPLEGVFVAEVLRLSGARA